jgi:hypothetical protein
MITAAGEAKARAIPWLNWEFNKAHPLCQESEKSGVRSQESEVRILD